ncbi:MAG: preprotein translocase subunit SecE [Candidatus Paracaedibacteraceae bacterium]|jgi:preprotein translocase subunit SecE|nr:preprotein translocase subunit SecE [Candidatus Paracaedibacteraceae bacterium]
MSTDKSFVQQTREFFPEVKQEAKRVTWPSWNETKLTTLFVFIFAVIAAIYFAVIDSIAYRVVNFLIGITG